MIHSRRLRAPPTLATRGWVLTTAGPIAAKTISYTPQLVYYTYCFSHPPAARIASGDSGHQDARRVQQPYPTDRQDHGQARSVPCESVDGTILHRRGGAGDTLKVHIDRIALDKKYLAKR